MDYNLFAYDKTFDLMSDPVPESLMFSFTEPVRRARTVLAGRTSAQVDAILGSMNPYLAKGGELLRAENQKILDREGGFIPVYRVKALKFACAAMPLKPLPNIPDVTWADYFAALSLAYLVEHLYEASSEDLKKTLEMERRLTKGVITEEMQQNRAVAQLNSMVFESLDAVAYAEKLQDEAKILKTESKRLASQLHRQYGKAGGQRRSDRYYGHKVVTSELYEQKYKHLSARKAASKIWGDEEFQRLPKILFGEEPWHTIEIWIGKHRRGSCCRETTRRSVQKLRILYRKQPHIYV